MTWNLGATQCVLEIRPRYKNVRKQNAQVRKDAHQTCLFKVIMISLALEALFIFVKIEQMEN